MSYGPFRGSEGARPRRSQLGGHGRGGNQRAFAAQVLSCMKGLDMAFDDPRIRTAALLLSTPSGGVWSAYCPSATRQLHCTGGRYTLISMCIELVRAPLWCWRGSDHG